MATFLMMSRHTPQNCPMFNAETRKVYANWLAKMQEIAQKHGIKLLSACTVLSEHLTVTILEAPSLEAIQRANTEPEFFALNMVDTTELKLAMNMEEAVKIFQQQAAPKPTR